MMRIHAGSEVKRTVRSRRWVGGVAVVALVAAAMLVAATEAGAGGGAPSALGVQPVEVNLGGQPNDCSATVAGRLPSAAIHELRIQNPQNGGVYAGPGGATFTLAVRSGDTYLDFSASAGTVVFDVVVKGGQKSTHFDYDTNGGPGGAIADQDLHAPTKGNGPLYSVSHVAFCYQDALPVSGTVFDDANQNGVRDSGEGSEAGRTITAYGPTSSVSTTSQADGGYVLYLSTGSSYTICERVVSGLVQIAPPGSACSGFTGEEAGGHVVTNLATAVSGLDFANAGEICGQNLTASGFGFVANFELFSDGNGETGCANKVGLLSVSSVEGVPRVNLPLTGTGEVAGIGVVTKAFSTPSPTFVPLEYAQDELDSFEILPWCGLRPKAGADGNQFDPYLGDDSMYPSLSGIFDPVSNDPAVSCKVAEFETADGLQTTVVLIQDDPFWK